MFGKFFFLVLVVLVAQHQAAPPPVSEDHPLAGVVQDFLNLFAKVLAAFFQNKKIPEECKNEFKAPPPLPKEAEDEIKACAAQFDEKAEEILNQIPEDMKQKVDDFINGKVKPSSISEVIELVRSIKEVGRALHKAVKEVGGKQILAEMLKCVNPLFKHIRVNFQQNVANFDQCVAKANP